MHDFPCFKLKKMKQCIKDALRQTKFRLPCKSRKYSNGMFYYTTAYSATFSLYFIICIGLCYMVFLNNNLYYSFAIKRLQIYNLSTFFFPSKQMLRVKSVWCYFVGMLSLLSFIRASL